MGPTWIEYGIKSATIYTHNLSSKPKFQSSFTMRINSDCLHFGYQLFDKNSVALNSKAGRVRHGHGACMRMHDIL